MIQPALGVHQRVIALDQPRRWRFSRGRSSARLPHRIRIDAFGRTDTQPRIVDHAHVVQRQRSDSRYR